MTDLRARAKNLTPTRWLSGLHDLRATTDGALYTAGHGLSAGLEGRIFGANMGVVTTPVAIAATVAIVDTSPQAWIRVPDSTVIIPLYAKFVVEATGITTQGEISHLIAQNDIGNGTSSAADVGPVNLNTAVPAASTCTARQDATGAATAPTNPLELSRFSFAASAVNQHFEWSGGNLGVYPIVRGAGSWAMYIGGNAASWYGQMVWMEFTEASVT